MATILQLIKKKIKKRKAEKAEEERQENPLDTALPLGLHIGGKIEISSVELLVSQSLAFEGQNTSYLVTSFGEAIILGQKVYKVYLEREDGKYEDKTSYLFISGSGEDQEIRWFYEADDVYPASEEEWNVWLLRDEGMIGWVLFKLRDDDERLFDRVWSASGENWVPPAQYKERITPDRYNPSERVSIQHESMLYTRSIPESDSDGGEHVHVSAQKSDEGDVVSIDVGIDLTASEITVVY